MAGGWYGMYNVPNGPALVTLYFVQLTGTVIFLWNMYAYVPLNFPTRMRGWAPVDSGWPLSAGARCRPPPPALRRPAAR